MFTKRQLKILDLVVKNSNGVTGTAIADILNVSSRTVRNDISSINSMFKDKKVKINSSNKKGYFVDSDHVEYIKNIINLLENKNNDYVESDERILKIMGKVFFHGKQSFYDISDELYLSEQMVYKECNKLRKFLNENYGYNYIKISGDSIQNESSEEIIRQLFFKMLKDSVSSNKMTYRKELEYLLCENFVDEDFENLYKKIKSFFEVHKISVDDKSMDMIAGSIYICVVRNNCGFTVSEKSPMRSSSIADLLIDKLENTGFNLTENDKGCLYDFLWCIKMPDTILDCEGISNTAFSIVNEFCTNVMEKYSFDLKESKDVINYLSVHIEYMLRRLDMGYELNNPMIDDIKKKYPLAYEIAMLIVHTIYKYKKKYPADDEISYVAVYIEYYLQMSNTKLKTVIINDNSMGVNNIIRNWIATNFSNQIEIVGNIHMHYLEKYMKDNEIDLIVSLREIPQNITTPSYVIENIPYKTDYDLLNSLIHKIKINHRYENITRRMFDKKFIKFYNNNESFEDVIKDMSLTLEKNKRIESAKKFSDDVIEREKIYPTAVGRYFAIPHPLATFAKQTTVSVAMLDKPVICDGREMKIIFLLAIENKIDDDVSTLFQFFKQIALDKKLFKSLLDVKNKDEFMEKMIYISKNIQLQ